MYVYFPSCKVGCTYSESSKKLNEYIKNKFNVSPIGCCKENYNKLTNEDIALVACNNCAAILEESSSAKDIIFVWEIIDKDPDFRFPDYNGVKMTVQDCWASVEKRHLQETIRSLMKKMNIEIEEISENFDKTKFHGTNLMAPCPKPNAQLAPKRYVEHGSHMFTPHTAEEQQEIFAKHCEQFTTEKIVCYCKSCAEAINIGGKKGLHIIELLFHK